MTTPVVHADLLDTPTGQFYVRDLPNLDLMRAFAVLLVFMAHTLETVGIRQGINAQRWDLPLGRLGVLLFFVHTSLVLMLSLQRSRFGGRAMFVSFYVRRLFRIYPLSIVTVVAVLAFQIPQAAWQTVTQDWGVLTIASNLLLVQNLTASQSVLGPLWSLPYELQMYVLLPIVYMAMSRFGGVRTLAVAWAAAIVLGSIPLAPFDLLRYAACFVPGMAAFVFGPRVRPRLAWYLWPIMLLATVIVFCGVSWQLQSPDPPWLGWLCCGSVGLSIPLFRQVPGRFLRATSHVIAKYSFGIYLSHLIALWFAFTWLPPMPMIVQIAVALGLVALASWAAFHLLEQPMIDLGTRLANHAATATARPAQGSERQARRASA